TLHRINRGHDLACTVDAYRRAASYGLACGGHLMFGLPGESRAEMVAQAALLSGWPALDSLKLHQLQIIKNTAMAREYETYPERFSFFTVESYVELVVDFLERLSPHIRIERLAGEVPPRFLGGPAFGLRSERVAERIIARMRERGTWQGRLYGNVLQASV
ncbi:MAG: TIGR01212 family radical SAM protein, partial [Bacteroidales bacterium]|nr:TIGR01212 family radical SAM protein [Bacteroidales bacterium]